MKKVILAFTLLSSTIAAMGDDGSLLWLGYDSAGTSEVISQVSGATADIAREELQRYWRGVAVTLRVDKTSALEEGAYKVMSSKSGVTITASSPIGLLYGAYALLRTQQCGDMSPYYRWLTDGGSWTDSPRLNLRLLNHWDNLDGSIERGYAGGSIFWHGEERGRLSDRQREIIIRYARANASIGINGAVLNNVNASPEILSRRMLKQTAVYADLLRPYGIRVYLSVNFASPTVLGNLKTADPQDDAVRRWWVKKANEIYRLIPDFGGFLVKANSENQPGPGDYGRSQSDGANMLAAAVCPHGGVIIWRSFVYSHNDGSSDRVMQAVREFKPLDGLFDKGVILQSKNGPLDFQPREPFAPIFYQMKKTAQMAELQITQEYTGQSLHLVFLAPMWNEFFRYVDYRRLKGIAGVANIGLDTNYCGHPFSQANWYAFGRMAWNPTLYSGDIAEEWLCQTFTSDSAFVMPMRDVMLSSREACVDYMMPLGLNHIFQFDHHYGPAPGGYRPDYPIEWCPSYYDRADSTGIGFDRTHRGSGAVGQYPPLYNSLYDDIGSCPEEYLLWFHHVPWNYCLRNGLSIMDNLRMHYDRGVKAVEGYLDVWRRMKPFVDDERWQEVERRLGIQLENARLWRSTCLDYYGRMAR